MDESIDGRVPQMQPWKHGAWDHKVIPAEHLYAKWHGELPEYEIDSLDDFESYVVERLEWLRTMASNAGMPQDIREAIQQCDHVQFANETIDNAHLVAAEWGLPHLTDTPRSSIATTRDAVNAVSDVLIWIRHDCRQAKQTRTPLISTNEFGKVMRIARTAALDLLNELKDKGLAEKVGGKWRVANSEMPPNWMDKISWPSPKNPAKTRNAPNQEK